MDQLADKYRKKFPILGTSTYLISNSLGAMPGEVADELQSYAELWGREGVESWNVWFPMVDEVSALFAPLIGVGGCRGH